MCYCTLFVLGQCSVLSQSHCPVLLYVFCIQMFIIGQIKMDGWMYPSSLCKTMLNFNSAKSEREQIIPQSMQVVVNYDGECEWYPVVVWSITHCPMDSTWFPFDQQHCSLIYEPWKYNADEVNITSYFGDQSYKAMQMDDIQPNDLWEILGKALVCAQRHFCTLCLTKNNCSVFSSSFLL